MKTRKAAFILLFPLLFLGACNRGDVKHEPYDDTPTTGEITILADESYQPLIQVQIDTFMELYKYAKINVRYLPESEIFNQLMTNDTIRLAITGRELTSDEKSYFESRKIIPRSLKIAEDAIALIVNPANTDTNITVEQLSGIVRGKISTWNQVSGGKLKDSIRVVYDRNGSANARYLKEKFLDTGNLPANSYATSSNAAVVDYVSNTPGAIGVIGVNWISDRDDPASNAFLKKIKVVGLAQKDSLGNQTDYFQPFQAYIALKNYPLTREVMIISREGRNGLGTGFASFVAADKGQRMIRMMGLLPATMPVRIIQVN
ncbi:MAG: substrate-binding domain-containing protein [Bacteroidetes bacterium]|nr:substrate-binding domain-containing protein [Bacteroidota bacterium]